MIFPNVHMILEIIIDQSASSPSVIMGVQTLHPYHNELNDNTLPFLDQGYDNKGGAGFTGARFVLNTIGDPQRFQALEDFLTDALSFDNILDVKAIGDHGLHVIDNSDILTNPVVWLFIADKIEDASAHRIQIHATDEFFELPHKAFLTRRLYTDSARVDLIQLQGGFSAQTYQVVSHDEHGRRLRPTVMKIADRVMITRESSRCEQYAMPYILNNSAMVLGAEFLGDIGALRYNFVGIGGEQSRLKWLTHYYITWPLEKLEPLFDKIFMQILHPWYGQSLMKSIQPFWDHNPTRTFFPHVFDEAESIFGVSADEPSIVLPETGEELLNPYWYLKHEYPRRHSWSMDYPTSICHGDLNMQNILLDDDMNVYLIDFSETRPRSVVSDFARLEVIFLTEQTTLQNESDFLLLIEIAKRLYGTNLLDQKPSFDIDTDEPTRKSLNMIMQMRQYSQACAGGDASMVSYNIALLEWMLPIVCYYSASHDVKRLSMIAASKICESLQRMLPEQA